MAGLTKEWLRLNIETLELEYSDLKPSAKNELAAYKIALAAMEAPAEPVYQAQYGEHWRDLNKAQYDDHVNHEVEGLRILYAAPPAHVPQPAAAQEPIATLNSMTSESGRLPYGTIQFLRMPTKEERTGLLKLYAEPQLSQPVAPDVELREYVQDFLNVLDEYPEQLVPINRNSASVRFMREAIAAVIQLPTQKETAGDGSN